MAAIDLVILIGSFTWQFTWNVTKRLVSTDKNKQEQLP